MKLATFFPHSSQIFINAHTTHPHPVSAKYLLQKTLNLCSGPCIISEHTRPYCLYFQIFYVVHFCQISFQPPLLQREQLQFLQGSL